MPPQAATVRVRGYREFLAACNRAERDTKYWVRHTFRQVGAVVQRDATAKFSAYDVKSALGYRTVVRQRGVSVEQKYRKTTGQRPNFGSLQMERALIPALVENESETVRRMEHAIDTVADRFEREP